MVFAAVVIAVAADGSHRRAIAQEPAATVTVTAAPISDTESQGPTSFVTVIEPAAHAGEMETVTDALAESVGVSVRRFGGLGAFSTLSIRGSSANQVQMYLDGVPLSRARNETVNLADLPLDCLERIEVYRGSAPANLGTAGIGGVVNLVTKPTSPTPATQLSTSYGSFDTRKVVVADSRQIHGAEVLGFVTYLGSAGNFTYEEQDPTAGAPAGKMVEQTRRNNAFDSVDGLIKAGYSLAPGLHLDLTSETFWKHQGVPGLGRNQSLSASVTDLRAMNYVRLRTTDLAASNLDLAGTLYGVYQSQEFSDPQGNIGTGPQNTDDRTELGGGHIAATYYLPYAQLLGWFSDLSYENFSPSNAVPGAPNQPDERRLHLNLTMQYQAHLWDDVALLVPTMRYEYLRDQMTGPLGGLGRPTIPEQTQDHELWSPSVGAQVSLWPWLLTRGNVGRYERAPNFSELFGNSGTIVGNPLLTPESATNWDAGFVATPARRGPVSGLRLEAAYFDNDVHDLIVLVQNSPAFARPINVSGARIRGEEVSLTATLLDHLRLDANYTHQNAENRSQLFGGIYAGKQLPGRPADEVFSRVEAFSGAGKLFYEFNYMSGNYLDQANFKPVSSRDIHTLGVSAAAGGPVTLTFEARNITNNQISDIGGFPLPGLSFFGTATANF